MSVHATLVWHMSGRPFVRRAAQLHLPRVEVAPDLERVREPIDLLVGLRQVAADDDAARLVLPVPDDLPRALADRQRLVVPLIQVQEARQQPHRAE